MSASSTTTAAPASPGAPLEAMRHSAQRHRRRYGLVSLTLVGTILAVSVAALTLGDFDLGPLDAGAALVGAGDGFATFVVVDLRLPRLLLGLLVGVALGLAGGLFQSVLRNPLASPDVIGISQGASAGAVLAILGLGLTGPSVAMCALLGAGATGALLYAVAWRGGLAGFRFVLTGIGVAYMASSLVGYLLTRSGVQEAQTALTWMAGSVGSAQWGAIRNLAVTLAVLTPLAALVRRPLALLLLGDDTATALGMRPERLRLAVIALGVALAAVATSAVGPVAFVALIAAPVARRLVDDGGLALLPCALTGAALVGSADLVGQHLLPSDLEVPVGIVTGAVGGPYLIWLLATSRRGGKVA